MCRRAVIIATVVVGDRLHYGSHFVIRGVRSMEGSGRRLTTATTTPPKHLTLVDIIALPFVVLTVSIAILCSTL